MRLIDGDALFINLDGMMAVSPTGYIHGDTVADMISDAPTIDAVTVADIIEVEKERNYWHGLADSYERTILKLNNALQESVPVRHGYWKNYKDEHTCSCCGETVTGDWYDQDNDAYWVCPWCGAWMDVERKEE